MIDFRYHLVSLIAVFLAIALGIIIGTTALNEPLQANIEGQVDELEQDKRALEDQTQQLQAQVETSDAFADAVAPALVDGALAGRSVLLVLGNEDVLPEEVEQLAALIVEAGGTVSGTISLQPAYSDPSTASSLQNYVTGPGMPPAGVELPETDDAGELVAGLLAQVLMRPADGPPGGGTDAPPTDGGAAPAPNGAAASSVLAGLVALEVLASEGDSVAPADYAIVLTSGGFTGDDAAERNDTLVELVAALDAAGAGAVVAGDAASAGETGLVGVLRADPTLSAAVSTVDNVGTAAGRISAVLALGGEAEGTSGRYGTGEDAQPVPPLPSPAP